MKHVTYKHVGEAYLLWKKNREKKTFYNLILHRNKLKYTQPHNKWYEQASKRQSNLNYEDRSL